MKCDFVPLINVSEVPLPLGHTKEDVLTVGRSDHQGESALINYFHYGVAGTEDDRGWGCGYRTLQTIASHINKRKTGSTDAPDLREIQRVLVALKDKPDKFLGSREWIGTFEAFLVLDTLYQVPCKILHAPPSGLKELLPEIRNHFRKSGCPAMMGGDADASSKCVLGVSNGNKQPDYLLIADPHLFTGKKSSSAVASLDKLLSEGWISWKRVSTDFNDSSFYNLCLPQL